MNEARKFPIGEIFHICNKSISNYHIFRREKLLSRFFTTLNYYNNAQLKISLSRALRTDLNLGNILLHRKGNIVHIIAYCIMPDHYHLLVEINKSEFFSKYINNVESSYTSYYNKLYNRKGPLWQSRFRAVHMADNSTLLHVHRYIHLNPTTAILVQKPEDWKWSSYCSYINDKTILETNRVVSIRSPEDYKKFVENQINYQQTIKGIRRALID